MLLMEKKTFCVPYAKLRNRTLKSTPGPYAFLIPSSDPGVTLKIVNIQCWEQAGSTLYCGVVELSPALCPERLLVGQ